MAKVPLRIRLTAAFATAMVVMLAAAALFVYLRLRADLDESIDAGLRSAATPVVERDEGFVQRVSPSGRLLRSTGGSGKTVLSAAELRRARSGEVRLERPVAGIEGTARILARPGPGGTVTVSGQSLDDRDETLGGVVRSFALGGALAVVLASALGYALAAAGLAPVEAMRRRAAEVSLRPGRTSGCRSARPATRYGAWGTTLNEMLDRLRRSFERERRFVADASHELRTPVAVIKAELETALRADDLDRATREALVAAAEECDHLAQLAEDLLTVARAGEDDLAVRLEPVPAGQLLEDARDRFSVRPPSATARSGWMPSSSLMVNADPVRMRQALGNLVDNALRHGDGPIVLSARQAPGTVELAVTDSGAGFPHDFAPTAFDRFARGPMARGARGSGLGLAIVAAVAEAHGGGAEIRDGPGATVVIVAPRRLSATTHLAVLRWPHAIDAEAHTGAGRSDHRRCGGLRRLG